MNVQVRQDLETLFLSFVMLLKLIHLFQKGLDSLTLSPGVRGKDIRLKHSYGLCVSKHKINESYDWHNEVGYHMEIGSSLLQVLLDI